ncbi:uncharacterized protein LOC133814923 [Humulus lupulus]|uniref:uncharacterized protein LOC133814923 n=1 Tax=Humulus lupulus TaxID=3486 RepID=UPI002B40BD9C|nr:uncharacterized protein LOC133814923 [Humulus lupulus]
MVQQNHFGGLATEDPNIHLAIFREPGTITTWDEMARKFLIKFFPSSKSTQLRSDIGQFQQLEEEPFYEAWERFKDLLRRFPQHVVDADAAGGALLAKTVDEAFTLMEEMATNSYQWPNERSGPRKVARLYEVDQMTAMHAQIAALQT